MARLEALLERSRMGREWAAERAARRQRSAEEMRCCEQHACCEEAIHGYACLLRVGDALGPPRGPRRWRCDAALVGGAADARVML